MQTDRLDEFNRQVLLLQDEAYSLAFCLLGDQTAASRVTQFAFEAAYAQSCKNSKSLKRSVLRTILDQCAPLSLYAGLSRRERCILLLVDHLAFSYEEAAFVLRCSPARVARRLALARFKAANCDRI